VPQPRYAVAPDVLARAVRILKSLEELTVEVVASIGQS
jgi:hypothetical protein